jgi:hypothetical protein
MMLASGRFVECKPADGVGFQATLSLAAAKTARLLGQRVGHPEYREVEKEQGRKGGRPPYFHCPLLRDEKNIRLAKRHDALNLRAMRAQGVKAEELRKGFKGEVG